MEFRTKRKGKRNDERKQHGIGVSHSTSREDEGDRLALNSIPFQRSTDFIKARFKNTRHDIAIVLGSGLGNFTKHLPGKIILNTDEIPDYPQSTVAGHKGEIISAKIANKNALVFSGRVHFYETGSTLDAAATAIVSCQLGIRNILLTNAAGILNDKFSPGDIMLIMDQLNLTFRDVRIDLSIRTYAANPVYDQRLAFSAVQAAERAGVSLKKGIYVGLTGPSYETPSEVKFYKSLGGDAVGMSTIQEALFAQSAGMRVLGISCLTNYSTGISTKKLYHQEVTTIAQKTDKKFSKLIIELINILS